MIGDVVQVLVLLVVMLDRRLAVAQERPVILREKRFIMPAAVVVVERC